MCNDFATIAALRGGVDPTQPNAVNRISLLDLVRPGGAVTCCDVSSGVAWGVSLAWHGGYQVAGSPKLACVQTGAFLPSCH